MEKEREQRKKEISLKTDKMTAEADAERQRIIDEKELATKKKAAEAERYRLEQLALGNSALHTPEHIRLEGNRSAHHNALMRKLSLITVYLVLLKQQHNMNLYPFGDKSLVLRGKHLSQVNFSNLDAHPKGSWDSTEVYTGEFYLTSNGSGGTAQLTFLNRKAKETGMDRDRLQRLERREQGSISRYLVVLQKIEEQKAAFEKALKLQEEENICRFKILEQKMEQHLSAAGKALKQQQDENHIRFRIQEEEWKQKEEEHLKRISLQEFQIEELTRRQKLLIESMEGLQEQLLNVQFPPLKPKLQNPFD